MADAAIPVDLFNPGQVFACLGIVEAADILLGDAAGVFRWDADETSFLVSANGSENPVRRVLRFIDEAEVKTRAPAGSENINAWNDKWGSKPEQDPQGAPFPSPDPNSPATLPAVLCDHQEIEVAIDYWADATRRDNVKFWAGAGGYPGSALLRDARDLVRGMTAQHAPNPFALSALQSSSFRFDWRRDYVPIDAGFSPNKHGKDIAMLGFPLVEILAAIGVTHARPKRTSKVEYHYGILGGDQLLDPTFLRAALGGATQPPVPVPYRRFVMRLDWPGKENHARCITHVAEESSNERNND